MIANTAHGAAEVAVKRERNYRRAAVVITPLTQIECKAIAPRFWAKVQKDGPTAPHMDSACWLWTAVCASNGYGRMGMSRNGRVHGLGAHRVSYILHYGEPAAGLYVLHRCDVRNCVNPAHLFVGTAKDNARDTARKGRCANGMQRPERARRVAAQRQLNPHWQGERHASAKLTLAQVREIRALAGQVSARKMARIYGVTHQSIIAILRGRTWKDDLQRSNAA